MAITLAGLRGNISELYAARGPRVVHH